MRVRVVAGLVFMSDVFWMKLIESRQSQLTLVAPFSLVHPARA